MIQLRISYETWVGTFTQTDLNTATICDLHIYAILINKCSHHTFNVLVVSHS